MEAALPRGRDRSRKRGTNSLEIRVANQWPNRPAGDEQLPEEDYYTVIPGDGILAMILSGAIEQLLEWYMHGKPKNGRVAFKA